MGRPTKCTPARIKQICKIIEAGNYAVVACQLSGITTTTYNNWQKLGEERPHSIYAKFLAALKNAEADAEQDLLRKCIVACGGKKGYWQGYMTILERRFRGRWGRSAVAVKGSVSVGFDPAAWQLTHLAVEHDERKGVASDTIELPLSGYPRALAKPEDEDANIGG